MWDYTEKVRQFFLDPKNAGEVEDPDAVGEVGSIVCGDALKITLRVDPGTERILEAKFQTFGCASAIASSSALTELVKGKTVDEALEISNQDIADFLGGLPKEKMHCSVMGREALEAAVANYRGIEIPVEEKGRLVCQCFEITEEKIRKVALENRLRTVEEVTDFTKAGGGCGSCLPDIEEILRDLWHAAPPPEPPAAGRKLTNLQKIALIQDVIETEIRPRLQADGGDMELIDIEGNTVVVGLRKMCAGCHMAGVTVEGIQEKLRELVAPEIVVEARE